MKRKLYLRFVPKIWELTIIAFAVVCIVHEEHWKVTQPHEKKSWVAGKLVSDYWTTNRFDVVISAVSVPTSNGLETVIVYHTNKLW
jgi:hypothetical protein